MQAEDTPLQATDAATLPRRTLIAVGAALILAACGLGAWIYVRGEAPFVIDVWWNELLAAWASPVVLGFSLAMNWLGGGWFGILAVPIGVAIVLLVVRRPWAAVFFVTSLAASAGAVQILKHTFGRARPEDIQVVSDYGSYPSGHVANAATISVALILIFPRVWVVVAGTAWVVLMALSRTYLHAHWLSDTLGGAMVGAGAAMLMAAVFAARMALEPRARALPPPA
jgi:undecaprenyl-diphosphatase